MTCNAGHTSADMPWPRLSGQSPCSGSVLASCFILAHVRGLLPMTTKRLSPVSPASAYPCPSARSTRTRHEPRLRALGAPPPRPPLHSCLARRPQPPDTPCALPALPVQTARSPLPGVFAGKMGWAKGDPSLRLTDEGAHAIVDRFTKRLKLSRALDDKFPEEELTSFAEALSGMVPATARTQPVQPDDLLMVLPLFVAEAAGGAQGTAAGRACSARLPKPCTVVFL